MSVLILLAYAVGAVLTLVLVAIPGFTGYLYYTRSKYSHLPSPKLPKTLTGFYLGHHAYIVERRKSTKNEEHPDTELYIEWYQELGGPGVYVIFLMHMPFVVLCDPEYIKKVTMQIKNDKPIKFRDVADWVFGERFMGNSLASVPDYNTWKPRRKIYDHSFNKSYLKSLLPSFNECTDRLLDGIKPLADEKTTVPMKQRLAEVTLNVISKVAFGTDFSEKWDDKALGLKWAKGTGKLTFLLAHTLKGIEKSFQSPLLKYFHPLEVQSYRETVRAVRIIGRKCIMERIRAVEAGEEIPRDILSSILQVASTKETVDIEDLVDDFVLFYIGGQETTSNLLSTTIVLIHQHPDVLYRLQAEVEEVLEGRTEVTHEDLEKLQYTEQVLLEVLRLYPPASGIMKDAMKGGIQMGEHFIPEGSTLFLITAMMSRLPEYFDNPDTFDPSRFNPENKQPSSFVYFPFGLGHRSCIGKHFALMEAKLILARLLQTFKFTLPPDYKLVMAQRGTLQPKDGVPCTIALANPQ